MSKKLTQDEFLTKAREIHGTRYDLSKAEYGGWSRKVVVTCPTHGDFEASAGSLFGGHGCPACGQESTTAKSKWAPGDLHKALQAVHPNYTFARIPEGQKVTEKIEVECPTHGLFMAAPHHLMRGKGCKACGRLRTAEARKIDQAGFLTLARKIHGDTYDYSKVAYTGCYTQVEIVCKEHGSFMQTAQAHYHAGAGCPSCGIASRAEKSKISFDEFVPRAHKAHGKLYTYSADGFSGVDKPVTVLCSKHGAFEQRGADHLEGHGCPKCSTSKNSKPQLEIVEFVRSLGLDVVENYKYDKAKHRKEIDIYIPEMKFGIEYHGIYFHSAKFSPRGYHLSKLHEAQKQGIRLAQVFSDEWAERPEVVKRYILHSLGYGLLSTYARKCEVVPITLAEANAFYDEHHIQGKCGHGISFGLAYKSETVAVMTFSKRVSRRGARTAEDTWELARFATSMRVTGGASRLMKHLISETGAKSLISYSDNRLFSGGMYEALGFKLDNISPPNYAYVDRAGTRRLHKAKFQHKHLAKLLGDKYDPTKSERENCEAAGYFQIFDCGLTRWKRTCP